MFYTASDCLLKDIKYPGQIYIQRDGLAPSSGVLQLYLNNEYLPLCRSGITQQAANSTCRTLGYTNALTSTTPLA